MDAQRLAGTDPEDNPALQRLLEEARARQSQALRRRERTVELLIAIAFLAAAIPMATLLPGGRSVDRCSSLRESCSPPRPNTSRGR
jgi:hypothetical protein